MELTIALAITIINCVLGVLNFANSRKKEAIQNTKENHQELIEYQLKELKDDVKAILSKLDKYEQDIDDRIDKAMELHLKMYHTTKGEQV